MTTRRGFLAILAGLVAAPIAAAKSVKRWGSRPGLVKWTHCCDHHPDKFTCDPKGGLAPPVMRCLCGMELEILHEWPTYQRQHFIKATLDDLGRPDFVDISTQLQQGEING